MADQLESLKTDLRSVLLTEKNGIDIHRLDREYRDVTGGSISYNRAQYRSLEAFLLTIPDTVRIQKYDGQTVCMAVCSEKQEDLQRLIRQQKTDKKKPAVRRPLQTFNNNYKRPVSNRPIYAKRFTNTPSSSSYNNTNSNSNGYKSNTTSNYNGNDGYQRRRTTGQAGSQSSYSQSSQSIGTLNGYTVRRSDGGDLSAVIDKQAGAVFDIRAQNGRVSVHTFKPEDQKPAPTLQAEPQQAEPQQSAPQQPARKRSSISAYDARHQTDSNESAAQQPASQQSAPQQPARKRSSIRAYDARHQTDSNENDENSRAERPNPYKKRYNENNAKKSVPSSKPDFEILDDESDDYKAELNDYAKEHGLPEPRYVSSSHSNRSRVIGYFSKVYVGDSNWQIFPFGYRTLEAAENGAAKKALEQLKRQANGDVPMQAADNLLHKLVQLFAENEILMAEAVENNFLAKFGHKLDSNWLDQVENSKAFDVQKTQVRNRLTIMIALSMGYLDGKLQLDSGRDVEQTAIDVSAEVKDDSLNSQADSINGLNDLSNGLNETLDSATNNSLNSPSGALNGTKNDVSVDLSIDQSEQSADSQSECKLGDLADQMSKSTLDESNSDEKDVDSEAEKMQKLPSGLLLDQTEDWPVMVLSVTNQKELVIRLIGNTEQLDILIAELHKFYNENQLGKPVHDLTRGRIYAAVFEGAVFRVQALLREDDQVHCYFLDDGIYEKIPKANLRELDDRFLQLPFQAFNVQLDGMAEKSDILFRKFFDEKMRSSDDILCLIAQPTSLDDPITVRLIDTSGSKDVNLNEELLRLDENKLATLQSIRPSELSAKLKDAPDADHRVVVSMAINPNNFVISSASLYKKEYEQLEAQLKQVYDDDEAIPLPADIVFPGMYVSIKDDDGRWYRARIEEQVCKLSSKFTAFLVDVGRITIVELSNIQPLYSQFFELPARVSRASLNDLLPTDDRFSIDAIVYFKTLMDRAKEFAAHDVELVTVGPETYLLLDLKFPNDDSDASEKSVSEELVNEGLARFVL